MSGLYFHRYIGGLPSGIALAVTAIAAMSAYSFAGDELWTSCGLGWTLLALAVIDFKYYILPDFLTLPLILTGLLAVRAFNPANLIDHAIGAAVGFTFIMLMRFVYGRLRGREGIGIGDAKMLAAAGAWVSWAGLPSTVLIAALSGLIFASFKHKNALQIPALERVPLGAFLSLGTWIVWLYGPLEFGRAG
jgi:leader peptidase (prepilin peptidase)/N-methyltransferase